MSVKVMSGTIIIKWLRPWPFDKIAMFVLFISIVPEDLDIPIYAYGNEEIIKIFFIGLKHQMVQSRTTVVVAILSNG